MWVIKNDMCRPSSERTTVAFGPQNFHDVPPPIIAVNSGRRVCHSGLFGYFTIVVLNFFFPRDCLYALRT